MSRRIFSVWDSVGRKSLKHRNNEKHKQTCKLQTFTSTVQSWNKRQIMKRNSNSAHPSESKTKQMTGCLHAFSILAARFINWLCCDYLYHMCCWIEEDHFLEITYVKSICMCFFCTAATLLFNDTMCEYSVLYLKKKKKVWEVQTWPGSWINISVSTSCVLTVLTYLYLHGFGLHHINLVLVATPDLVVHYSHAADGVVGFPQV